MRRPIPPLVALALACAAFGAGTARAQSADIDLEPPVIELESLGEAAAGRSQVFAAQVVDDRGLRDVLLYHRRAGGRPFEAVAMRPVGDSAFHSVTLPTDPDDLRDIEYYVQARDTGGNRSVSGFAFEPFVRRLRPAAVAPAMTSAPGEPVPDGARASAPATGSGDDAPSIVSKVRWWHVALGVVTVGTLAALSGGGSDGGSGPTVPLTLNLGEPER